jgi:dolichol-phosphate mannosyltransferase
MGVDIPYRKAVYLDCGFSSAFIEYEPTTKKSPKQFKDKFERLELAISVLIYFTDIVKKFAVILASIVSVAFVVFLVGILTAVICGQTFSLGWLSVTVLLFVVSIFLLWMGVLIIKYLSVILEVVFNKQKYLISSIDNVPSKKEYYGESK